LLGERIKIKLHAAAKKLRMSYAPSCLMLSVSSTRCPSQQDKDGDHPGGNQHPVLALEAQKYKTLDEKLHRTRPQFWAE
jgi:hypothetical protein